MTTNISADDKKDLQTAKNLLDNPGLAMKITNLIGKPIEKGFELLPDKWESKIGEITEDALGKAAEAAIFTMKENPGEEASNWWHKFAVATSGGAGGFFGLIGLPIELPVSTTIMLRSIADVARSQGASLNDAATKTECVAVLGLGGRSKSDDAADAGYLAIRATLARSVAEASEFLASKTLTEEGAPVLVRLIANVAARFSLQVSEKVAAQAVPVIGAASGALINTLFIDHFQDMARGHFTVLRLEKKYSKEAINALYLDLPRLA